MTEAGCGGTISFEILSWIPLDTLEPPSGHSVMERELFPVHQEMGDVFSRKEKHWAFTVQLAEQICQGENGARKAKGSGTQIRASPEIAELLYFSLIAPFYPGISQ